MVGRIDDFVANVVALIKDGGTLAHLFGPGGSDDCWLGLVLCSDFNRIKE